MKIEQLCQTMKEFFSQYAIVRILFPLSSVILYVCGALSILNGFIYLGSVVSSLAFLVGVVMMILTLSQCQFFSLSIGIGLYALNYAIAVIRSVISFRSIAYGSLVYLLFYGVLAFLAYRKSLSLR